MILSFHPVIETRKNIICAGREPNTDDLAAIKRAKAVILPQGCSAVLYRMARQNCTHVFPNMDIRFDYPGKQGQIRLFRSLGLDYPNSRSFDSLAHYKASSLRIPFPSVVKLDWGGQGETVFKADNPEDLDDILKRIESWESTGQHGFLIQDFIPHANRSLRVVVIGTRLISYWRCQPSDAAFGTSMTDGAVIDHSFAPRLQATVKKAAQRFCSETGLQLAGLDYIFDESRKNAGRAVPLILEINYFFGRTGLGGSEKYYELLNHAVDHWLSDLGLTR